MANIEEKVQTLVEPIIEDLGYSLYDVEYAKEGKDYFLRIFIDSKEGISLTDCEKVTNAINDILDKEDCIKEGYFLEVSSPGIERIIRKEKHLEQNIGNEVEIKLFRPIDKQKTLSGILLKYDNESIYLNVNSEEKKIEKQNIAQIKTKYNW